MPLLPTPEPLAIVEDVKFPAGSNMLHGKLSYPETGCTRGLVVLAGPHPLLGGNIQNNVVRCLGDGLAEKKMMTLRFDYRGVGQSEGPPVDIGLHLAEFWKTSHAPNEMDLWSDIQGAVEFIELAAPGLPLALVGYSFGCSLLPFLLPRENLANLVLIAPTVAKHNYDSFQSVSYPLLVVASEDDFATDMQQLDDWFNTLSMPRQLVRKQCDNHFFRGHEEWLVETVFRFLTPSGRGDV